MATPLDHRPETPVGPLAYWPTDTRYPWIETTVGDRLREHAARIPDAPAVFWDRGGGLASLTYAQLTAEATELATRLPALAPRVGDRVAVCTPNSVEWVVLYYACALSGRVIVSLNPVFSDAELEHAVEQSGARVLFAVREFRGSSLLDRVTPVMGRRGGVALDLARWRELPAQDAPLPTVAPHDPLLIQYTSGTTGRPKGAVLSHTCAYNNAHLRALLLEPGPHEVWCSPAAFYHVAGSVSRVLGAMSVGGAVVVVSDPRADVVLDLMERTRTTHGGLIGKLALDLLDNPTVGERDLSALTSLAMGGTAVPAEVVQRLVDTLGVAVVNGYGQSESPHITGTRPDDTFADRLTAIGRPLPHREVCIMRPATTETAALGEVGEICTRGPLVMDGYFDNPAATAATVDAAGWLHTGDLGEMDGRGVLYFRGRIREVIIRGGENVYPPEVEGALARCPGVAEVAVIGVPDARWGEQVMAFVRPEPGAVLDPDVLTDYARTVLAPFKIPRLWRMTDDLPRTASGKVRKNLLVEQMRSERRA